MNIRTIDLQGPFPILPETVSQTALLPIWQITERFLVRIPAGPFAYAPSIGNLLGEDPDPALLEKVSIEKFAGAQFPPTFLWGPYTDGIVPAENSLLLANRLRECAVSVEYHIFHEGDHDLSLCDRTTATTTSAQFNPHCGRWFDLCAEWLCEIWEE